MILPTEAELKAHRERQAALNREDRIAECAKEIQAACVHPDNGVTLAWMAGAYVSKGWLSDSEATEVCRRLGVKLA